MARDFVMFLPNFLKEGLSMRVLQERKGKALLSHLLFHRGYFNSKVTHITLLGETMSISKVNYE